MAKKPRKNAKLKCFIVTNEKEIYKKSCQPHIGKILYTVPIKSICQSWVTPDFPMKYLNVTGNKLENPPLILLLLPVIFAVCHWIYLTSCAYQARNKMQTGKDNREK